MNLYETDFYEWTQDTAARLARGDFAGVDVPALKEEVEDMGKSERSALESRLIVLVAHLLKWDVQPERRGHSWRATIAIQRRQIEKLLLRSPSLRRILTDDLADLYSDAVMRAVEETNLDPGLFPQTCPYTSEEILRSKTVVYP